MRRPLLSALLALAAPAAGAADRFAAPEGCQGFLTVQMRGCQMSNHFTCAGDPPGHQWDTYIDGGGAYFTSQIDHETQWILSIDHEPRGHDRLEPGAADPASFSLLLAEGRDDYDFVTVSDNGRRTRYAGFDRLTGETVRIDGQVLERTEFDLTASDAATGALLFRRTGTQYVSRDWRLFFPGEEEFVSAAGEATRTDNTPVEFLLPGERGFFGAEPRYDCDMMMTGAPARITPVSEVLP